jgi:aryl-alcohol dehydrogenase-like predicted oxidoreductase
VQTKQLGRTSLSISAVAYGAVHLSLGARPEESQSLRIIHHLLSEGITVIDTADSYCLDERDLHHNERLVFKALTSYSLGLADVLVATKGGVVRPGGLWKSNGSPSYLRTAIRASFEALGGDRPIDLWQLHAVDPDYPLEASLAPAAEAVKNGFIRFVGLSNVNTSQIMAAMNVVEVVSIQNEFNLWNRKCEMDGTLDLCERQKITFFSWGSLGGPARHRELSRVPVLSQIAREKNTSAYAIALAWLSSQSDCIVPIFGSSNVNHINEVLTSTRLRFTHSELAEIEEGIGPLCPAERSR